MHLPRRSTVLPRLITLVITAGALLACSRPVFGQDDAADWERLAKALQIGTGSVVAEIGAGEGQLTVAAARAVGPEGRVYSNELDAGRRDSIAQAVENANLDNVTIVEGQPARTGLPQGCCDAIFMRRVYHHFGDPAAMNLSLLESLEPGGRLAVIDFPPRRGGDSADARDRDSGDRHGVTPDTVATELTAAGFEIVSTDVLDDEGFMVVAVKPAPR